MYPALGSWTRYVWLRILIPKILYFIIGHQILNHLWRYIYHPPWGTFPSVFLLERLQADGRRQRMDDFHFVGIVISVPVWVPFVKFFVSKTSQRERSIRGISSSC